MPGQKLTLKRKTTVFWLIAFILCLIVTYPDVTLELIEIVVPLLMLLVYFFALDFISCRLEVLNDSWKGTRRTGETKERVEPYFDARP
jgi:hypothetical protein